jgi:type I restriction enzyme M protein
MSPSARSWSWRASAGPDMQGGKEKNLMSSARVALSNSPTQQVSLDLVNLFGRLDDVLQAAGCPKDERYETLTKMLLVKLFTEERGQHSEVDDQLLARVLDLHGSLLPDGISSIFNCPDHVVRELWDLLSPVRMTDSSPELLQDFFMHFAPRLYKRDLSQHFTPYPLLEFIVKIVNPTHGDRIIDPACGTADFLIAATRVAQQRHGADLSARIRGVDISETASRLARLNLLLNGCAAPVVGCGDSLREVASYEGQFTVALCNPPFGVRLVERRGDVLQGFELGTSEEGGRRVPLPSQEVGLLFVEVCLRAVVPGGRVAIILPNGYLGNRSARYVAFRRWLLANARIAAVIGFPRFAFKRSGADVSASVVIFERRYSGLRCEPAHQLVVQHKEYT